MIVIAAALFAGTIQAQVTTPVPIPTTILASNGVIEIHTIAIPDSVVFSPAPNIRFESVSLYFVNDTQRTTGEEQRATNVTLNRDYTPVYTDESIITIVGFKGDLEFKVNKILFVLENKTSFYYDLATGEWDIPTNSHDWVPLPEEAHAAGLVWRMSNVQSNGSFGKMPNSSSKLFTFEEAQTACPEGWRLPTHEEFVTLLSTGGRVTSVNGGWGGVLFESGEQMIFFTHISKKRNSICGYWTSSLARGSRAWAFTFNAMQEHMKAPVMSEMKRKATYAVRCVKQH